MGPKQLLLATVAGIMSGFVSPAHANPDVWIEAGVTYRFDGGMVTGMTYDWKFDAFFSSLTIDVFDTNANGTLDPIEVEQLRAETFDPLDAYGYHLYIWEAGERREEFRIESFSAEVEDMRLVYRFTVAIDPPADPRAGAFITSLHDPAIFVDFAFREADFLMVEGEMGADCGFRIARGEGDLSGHRQPVSLKCGDQK